MRLYSTHTLHLQHLWSDPHLESDQRFVVELFYAISQAVDCVYAVDCFRRAAPSLTFANFFLKES